MKVLVTGGAGYIGSVVTWELAEQGEEVVVLDNLQQGHEAAVHPQATFVQADLADKAKLNEIFATHRPEAVMHFASHTLVGESMEKPFMYLGDNVRNGLNLFETAVEHGTQRFILSSTANLFDEPERVPISEDEHIRPGSPYGESKYILERLLHWLDVTKGVKHAAFRYFNACGATPTLGEDHSPETHLIPLVLQVALGQREKIFIFGDDYDTPDGTCVRDYVHVLDLADAHIRALRALSDGQSRTYNLGIGQGFSVREIIEAAREITGHPIPAEVSARRPGDPAILIAGNEKVRRELGWEPRFTDLHAIIESAWQWHKAHPQGYGG
ncbi:MAG: UDP-glucose 4-epimerase GalE [Anaerolineales bacterium]|nr:UDP-glucose 4-epimerase GalE [Anaerolineales bacterium]